MATTMKWQPIETAPKDKTRFLAWPRVNARTGERSQIIVRWYLAPSGYGCWTSDGLGGTKYLTHWQPLPEPPKEQSA